MRALAPQLTEEVISVETVVQVVAASIWTVLGSLSACREGVRWAGPRGRRSGKKPASESPENAHCGPGNLRDVQGPVEAEPGSATRVFHAGNQGKVEIPAARSKV